MHIFEVQITEDLQSKDERLPISLYWPGLVSSHTVDTLRIDAISRETSSFAYDGSQISHLGVDRPAGKDCNISVVIADVFGQLCRIFSEVAGQIMVIVSLLNWLINGKFGGSRILTGNTQADKEFGVFVKRLFKTGKALVAAASFTFGSVAVAADYTLTISSWAPPGHGINSQMWPNLINMIEEATDGRVTAEVKYGLAPPPAQMDLVLDGAADMTIVFHGYQAGRFVATKLIELPGYEGNAEAASVAYWRVHEELLAEADEHRGVKLIGLHTHGPAQLHSDKPISTLNDIEGMKVRVPGGVGSDVVAALGGTGIKVPAPKVYETLASKAADGVVMPFESRGGFKLTEVAKNVYEVPGGLYRGSFAYLMSQEAFDGLPADLQKALEEKVFGEPTSRMAGKVWDEIDSKGRQVTMATDDNAINEASSDDLASYQPIADGIIEKVLAEVSEKGIDGEAARAMIIKEMSGN